VLYVASATPALLGSWRASEQPRRRAPRVEARQQFCSGAQRPAWIEPKLRSILARHPRELIEILRISGRSDDSTDELVRGSLQGVELSPLPGAEKW